MSLAPGTGNADLRVLRTSYRISALAVEKDGRGLLSVAEEMHAKSGGKEKTLGRIAEAYACAVSGRLKSAAQRLETLLSSREIEDVPGAIASCSSMLGLTYYELGDYGKAKRFITRAVGRNVPREVDGRGGTLMTVLADIDHQLSLGQRLPSGAR
jgi:hypothetical protein